MRSTLALAAAIAWAVVAPAAADAASPPPIVGPGSANTAPVVAGSYNSELLTVGAGAVLGVLAFNLLSAPLGIVPLAGGALEVVPESVALGSRLIAVTTAGAGAIGANWLYDRWTGQQTSYNYLLTLGAGALAGVAVGNYLTGGTVGALPYVGSGVANLASTWASPAAQAASRVYVVGSAAIGAWAADWLYHH